MSTQESVVHSPYSVIVKEALRFGSSHRVHHIASDTWKGLGDGEGVEIPFAVYSNTNINIRVMDYAAYSK